MIVTRPCIRDTACAAVVSTARARSASTASTAATACRAAQVVVPESSRAVRVWGSRCGCRGGWSRGWSRTWRRRGRGRNHFARPVGQPGEAVLAARAVRRVRTRGAAPCRGVHPIDAAAWATWRWGGAVGELLAGGAGVGAGGGGGGGAGAAVVGRAELGFAVAVARAQIEARSVSLELASPARLK